MNVLQPYIDKKQLVVRSGQTELTQVTTLRWDGATAQRRMDDILTKSYKSETVDAVLSPYDGISIGILSALKSDGYGTKSKPLPVITGQDAEVASVKSIIAGEQSMTVYKDLRKLAKVASDMVDALLNDKKPEVNDTKTYDNGSKVVAGVPAGAGRREQGQLQEGPRRLRLLQGKRPQVTAGPYGLEGTTMAGPVLEMRSIVKTFPGVKALSDVNLTVRQGEVHAVCGENGAGKSTLMKVLSGVHPHGTYEGEILFEGEVCRFKDIRASEQRGIVIIHQELALVPFLSSRRTSSSATSTRGAVSSTGTRPCGRPPRCCAGWGSTTTRRPGSPTSASASSSWWRSPRRCRRR